MDCPSALHCAFVPAAYAQDSSDPGNYGNYDKAGRPDDMLNPAGQTASMKINYIIIHDTEGSYDSTISTFQNPASYVSANYVIRSSDGAATEMVRPHDVTWGAGNWYINMHAINIENEGFAAQGNTWYTEAMYRSGATLVRYLQPGTAYRSTARTSLATRTCLGRPTTTPRCSTGIQGRTGTGTISLALVHGESDSAEQASGGSVTRSTHHLVTIDPTFAQNGPRSPTARVVAASPFRCSRPTLRFTCARSGISYPLLGDLLLHPDGSWPAPASRQRLG